MPRAIRPEEVVEAAEFLRRRLAEPPRVAVIAGSGLADLAAEVEAPVRIEVTEVPGWPVPTVQGHGRELWVGRLGGQVVAVQTGRVHLYEGYSPAQVVFNVRVYGLLGVQVLIVTNAAGGLNPEFRVGDLMLIADHINLPGLAGFNPLRGPDVPEWGPRFPGMVDAYSPRLRALARQAAAEAGFLVREGVYAMVGGPSYETPAEVRMLRALGADAVGMSTAPEVVAARQMGLEVLGIAGITNVWGEAAGGPTHAEVLLAGAAILPRLKALVRRVIGLLP